MLSGGVLLSLALFWPLSTLLLHNVVCNLPRVLITCSYDHLVVRRSLRDIIPPIPCPKYTFFYSTYLTKWRLDSSALVKWPKPWLEDSSTQVPLTFLKPINFGPSGRITADNIIASSPKRDEFLLDQCKTMGLNTTHENAEVVQKSDVIFLAVKPVHVSKVASEIAPALSKEHLVVSIALGITIRNIESVTDPM